MINALWLLLIIPISAMVGFVMAAFFTVSGDK